MSRQQHELKPGDGVFTEAESDAEYLAKVEAEDRTRFVGEPLGKLTAEQRARQRMLLDGGTLRPIKPGVDPGPVGLKKVSCGLCFETRECLTVPVDGNPYESATVCRSCALDAFEVLEWLDERAASSAVTVTAAADDNDDQSAAWYGGRARAFREVADRLRGQPGVEAAD